MTLVGLFSYNSFVKFHNKKEPQHDCYSAANHFDYHKYGCWSNWNLIHTSYFQSVHVLILWRFILVFKTGHVVAVFMYSLITHQSKLQCPYARRQEYWSRRDCFIVICKHTALYSLEIPTFSFYSDWFSRHYKDQTDNKLPKSGLVCIEAKPKLQ